MPMRQIVRPYSAKYVSQLRCLKTYGLRDMKGGSPGAWKNHTMDSSARAPKHMKSSFNCPRCGAFTGQDWFDLQGQPVDGSYGARELKDSTLVGVSRPTGASAEQARWTASKCFACKNHSIWVHTTLAYPDRQAAVRDSEQVPNDDMPQDAADLFNEAVAVLPYSRRAAAALCRASMERLVKSLDPDCPRRAKLDERLARLEGRVSSTTIDLLNVLRHVGNTALHGEQDGDGSATIYVDEDDETIAETFFLVINTLVDELITKPRRTAELYKNLPEGVRSSYEAKAGRVGE